VRRRLFLCIPLACAAGSIKDSPDTETHPNTGVGRCSGKPASGDRQWAMWQCSDVARAISTVRSTVLRTVDTGSHSHALACDLIVRRAFFRVAVSIVRVSVVAGVCVVLLVVRSTPYWVNPAAVHLGVFDKQRGAHLCLSAWEPSKQVSKRAKKQGSKEASERTRELVPRALS